jgi:uncharacterized protein with HEPN domain
MKSDLELFVYVLEQINALMTFYDGKDEEEFLRNDILKDACLMKLVVIGEYSSRISQGQKTRFTELEWQLLKAARNYYAYAYGSITWKRVWETLEEDIPKLKVKIENIISILEKENNAKTN